LHSVFVADRVRVQKIEGTRHSPEISKWHIRPSDSSSSCYMIVAVSNHKRDPRRLTTLVSAMVSQAKRYVVQVHWAKLNTTISLSGYSFSQFSVVAMYFVHSAVLPARLELARPCERGTLSRLCLPIPRSLGLWWQ
jgi:hypothetical protein